MRIIGQSSIPADWPGYTVTRRFRNAVYAIEVQNPERVHGGVRSVTIDGQPLNGTLLPSTRTGRHTPSQ
ncbi:MAG: hypothetical protein U0452_09955 [Anaerolineae bacterium]